jgi:hypothetical protein
MDQRIESFLADVLALDEEPDAIQRRRWRERNLIMLVSMPPTAAAADELLKKAFVAWR